MMADSLWYKYQYNKWDLINTYPISSGEKYFSCMLYYQVQKWLASTTHLQWAEETIKSVSVKVVNIYIVAS